MYTDELIELVKAVSDAAAYLDNCRYADQDKARTYLNTAINDLRYYYDTEIYDEG